MKKRKILIVLVGLLFISIIEVISPSNILSRTVAVRAEEINTIEQGDYIYELNDDGTAKIIQYKGNEEEVFTPNQVISGDKIYQITEIGKCTFSSFNIKKIHVSEGVKKIEEYAFFECDNLEYVDMTNTVETIGEYGFYNCHDLKNVKLSENLKYIGEGAFIATSLVNIDIPNSVEQIGKTVFQQCRSLESIKLPENIKSNITPLLLEGCENLKSIDIDKNNKYYKSIDNIVYNNDLSKVILAARGIEEDICIPEGVVSVGENAFYGCSKIKNIILPKSLTNIGDYAFYHCSSISSIAIGANVNIIGKSCFLDCNNLRGVEIEGGNVKLVDNIFCRCSSLENIRVENCTNINDEFDKYLGENYDKAIITSNDYNEVQFLKSGSEFIFDKNLMGDIDKLNIIYEKKTVDDKEYEIELNQLNSKARIVKYKGNSDNVNVPSKIEYKGKKYTVTALADRCFYNNKNLVSVNIPDTIKEIGNYTFLYCFYLKNVKLPKDLIEIGDGVFQNCTRLEEVDIPAGVKKIGKAAFKYTGKLNKMKLPKELKIISEDMFYKSDIEKIKIPKGVIKIEKGAFQSCNKLNNVELPEGITSIGEFAFCSCECLQKVKIPSSLLSISYGCFYECKKITNMELPEGITSIESLAFSKCENLQEVKVPSSILSIGRYSFEECNKLTNIRVKNSFNNLETIKANIGSLSGYYMVTITSDNYNELQFVRNGGNKLVYDKDNYNLIDNGNLVTNDVINSDKSYALVKKI